MTRTSRIFLIGLAVLASGCTETTKTKTVETTETTKTKTVETTETTKTKTVETAKTDTVEVTEYSQPKDDDTLLVDDRLEDKKTTFNPDLVDRRPLLGWSLNASDAVIKLATPLINPDFYPESYVLHPSYAAAIKANRGTVLPSVNLIDGKAKQFDDGLYAALDQAYFLGHGESMKSHLETLRRIREKVAKGSPADDYLAAGLSLQGEKVELSSKAKSLADGFLSQEVRSKPIGFYTWNKTLSDTFRVLRFFAQPIEDLSIPVEIARILRADPKLRDDYVRAYTFYGRLTNPLVGRTPADLVDGPPPGTDESFSLFPQSTSREVVLFQELFPKGLPPDANLIRELITAIRSGKVDLKPDPKSGWYEYQAFALETLLLPERGPESNKLLLTKAYKKRMLEAFQALITKRRETHSGEDKYGGKVISPQEVVSLEPRLRVEPNPTFYLRTARSYAFLANFLESTLGEGTLKSLKGLREGGERELDLHSELARVRSLFYGLYLLSAEDIGLKPEFLEGEPVDREGSEKVATDWLASIATDPDLAVDTRVAVPIYYNPQTGVVRLWMTVGVRLTMLEASYVKPPSLRPLEGSGEWKAVEPTKLKTTFQSIPVDEFAEVEIRGSRVLNRAELRAICDRMKTKEKIVEAIRK
jgi:hypothetical protein